MTEAGTVDGYLHAACLRMAREALWRNQGVPSDVVETLAQKYLTVAQECQDHVRTFRDSDDVIAHAVLYLADVQAVRLGSDVEGFRHCLNTVLHMAVPFLPITAASAKLMPEIQQGVRQSLAEVPVSNSELRLEEGDARSIRRLIAAGVEHGEVSDLLDMLERLFHGEQMSTEDRRLLFLASLAAPLTSEQRQHE